jgi:hypothetical protein
MTTEIQTLVTQRNVPSISTVRDHKRRLQIRLREEYHSQSSGSLCIYIVRFVTCRSVGLKCGADGCVWHAICRVSKMTAKHDVSVLADGSTVCVRCQEGSILLFRPPIRCRCTSDSPFAFSLKGQSAKMSAPLQTHHVTNPQATVF